MGLSYATVTMRNDFSKLSLEIKALVDTGAVQMCIPQLVAEQLGFDTSEARTTKVTMADGGIKKVPVVGPVLVSFEDRQCWTEALVLGDEALLGCIPMEAMDLIVRPRDQKLVVNPVHPNFPVLHVK